jgi:hypothetical protein
VVDEVDVVDVVLVDVVDVLVVVDVIVDVVVEVLVVVVGGMVCSTQTFLINIAFVLPQLLTPKIANLILLVHVNVTLTVYDPGVAYIVEYDVPAPTYIPQSVQNIFDSSKSKVIK